ncbi:glycosyltransferase [bacterium]|nr:glycosyltransferase [bacterium]
MTLWILLLALPLAGMIVTALINAIAGPRMDRAPTTGHQPTISVLVPARNEEKNIEACLKGLLQQEYPIFEVIVLDDGSTDRTGTIIHQIAEQHSNLRALEGAPLPEGWSGKNWACHQLQQQAAGEILIFTDADNTHHPAALAATAAFMEEYRLDLFSAFPQQLTSSLADRLVVPVVELFVYAMLPLWLTLKSRFASLSAANGQWLAFRREAYRTLGGHQAVRISVVEDVTFGRRAKQAGFRLLTASGRERVFGQMYSGWRDVWLGFSKNLYVVGGGRTVPFVLLEVILLAIFVLPYFLLILPGWRIGALLLIGLNLILRSVVAIHAVHPKAESVLLHPFGVVATLVIGWNSMLWHRRGRFHWKGRTLEQQQKPLVHGEAVS